MIKVLVNDGLFKISKAEEIVESEETWSMNAEEDANEAV